MNRYELLQKLAEVGLAHRAAEMERFLLPAIRVDRHKLKADNLPIGASKLGGLPDLPLGVEWPHCEPLHSHVSCAELRQQGGPLWFLGQTNLAELATWDFDRILPPTGMLYFFCALWRSVFPNDGANGDGWKVLYYDGDLSRLLRTPVPPVPKLLQQSYQRHNSHFQTAPCSVAFSHFTMLPWDIDANVSLTREEHDLFFDNCEEAFANGKEGSHHLLGYPQPVQWYSMAAQCEEFTRPTNPHAEQEGLSALTLPKTEAERRRLYRCLDEERGRRAQWRLLFQVDTDSHIGLDWQTAGRGYFWIRKDDLAARNFDHVCLVNQYT